jgi:phosphate transport system permease protein
MFFEVLRGSSGSSARDPLANREDRVRKRKSMATETTSPFRDWLQKHGTRRRGWEKLIEWGLLACGLLSIAITISIASVILVGSFDFFTTTTVKDGELKGQNVWMGSAEIWERFSYFFTGTEWTESTEQYGIWPLLSASLIVTLIAAAVAIPLGLLTATYLSEYASPKVRSVAKPTLELLAGIPTVVYGFFAITVITPMLVALIPGMGNPNNLLSGGIVVGIMIIPMVASLSEDALRAVPNALRDGAIALGANKYETSVKVVIPAALSGVTASFLLAISRALGETMAVTLACGETARLVLDPRQGAATMTAFIVHRARGEVDHFSTEFNSLFAVAGVLFVMTLGMNIIAQKVLKRFRQVYQ